MSGAGHASDAIFNRLYLADKTMYSRPLCNLQYLSIDAAKLARITGLRGLVSEWQGRELVKSAAYPQLSENDQVQLANRKVVITLLFLQIDARNAFYIKKPGATSPNLRSKPEPEVVLAAILDTIGAKSREDASKRHWRDIVTGASEADLLAFHFRSRVLDRK